MDSFPMTKPQDLAPRNEAVAARKAADDDGLCAALFEAAPDGLLFIDEGGVIRRANALAHEMFARAPGSLIGEGIERLVPAHLREAHAIRRSRYAAAPVKRGMGIGLDLLAQRADGAMIPVDISLSPVEWRGRRFVIAAVRDMTERRRIEQALRQALEQQAMRDPLTGLFNRRVLDDALPLEMARARRRSKQVAVVMADIDRFKNVNDRYGHACGDTVLRRMALLLQVGMRAGDILCRYGGEEFTMILPECSVTTAGQRAEALRATIEQTIWAESGCQVADVTMSFGVAAYPADGDSAEEVLRAADRALLRAKAGGRNRVVRAGEPASDPTMAQQGG
jgi:diguanylate cyclase (GGDEF)-like protein/PAS domain S-box-containing protein